MSQSSTIQSNFRNNSKMHEKTIKTQGALEIHGSYKKKSQNVEKGDDVHESANYYFSRKLLNFSQTLEKKNRGE